MLSLFILLMSFWKIAGIAVVAILVLGGIYGFYDSSRRKANAGDNLEKIKQLHAKGELNEAMKLLAKSFYQPVSDKYSLQEAQVAYDMILEAEGMIKDMNIDARAIIEPAKLELGRIKSTGGEVNSDNYTAFTEMLDKIEFADDEENVAMIMNAVMNGDVKAAPEAYVNMWGEKSSKFDEVINGVGKLILRNKLDDALTLLNGSIPLAKLDGDKASLLNQRGTVYFMQNDFAAAVKDYTECISLEPDYPTHRINLAEALVKAGDISRAKEIAAAILNKNTGIDKYNRQKLQDIEKL